MDKLKNLLSRKFLITIVSNIVTILVALGVDNDMAQIISFLALIVINAVYVIVEGSIDKADIANTIKIISDVVGDLADQLDEEEDGVMYIDELPEDEQE